MRSYVMDLFAPDISGLPPAQRYAAEADRASDPAMAESYRTLSKSMTASEAALAGYLRSGTAYKLSDGTTVPVSSTPPCCQRRRLLARRLHAMTLASGVIS
jgi:anti-sigma factor RsiW